MKTIKLGEIEYEIIPVPLDLTPYTTMYSELATQKPSNMDDAEKISKQLKEIIDVVVARIAKPKPQEEDKGEIFNFATAYTADLLLEQTKFFRKSEESISDEG